MSNHTFIIVWDDITFPAAGVHTDAQSSISGLIAENTYDPVHRADLTFWNLILSQLKPGDYLL